MGPAGDDKLFGDNGKDGLFGKAGIDQSTGGLGADRFMFRASSEAAADGPVYEEFLDFNRPGRQDRPARHRCRHGQADGNQPFEFIGDAPLTGPGQLHVETFDGDFLVSGTVDADLAADFAILVRTGACQPAGVRLPAVVDSAPVMRGLA